MNILSGFPQNRMKEMYPSLKTVMIMLFCKLTFRLDWTNDRAKLALLLDCVPERSLATAGSMNWFKTECKVAMSGLRSRLTPENLN